MRTGPGGDASAASTGEIDGEASTPGRPYLGRAYGHLKSLVREMDQHFEASLSCAELTVAQYLTLCEISRVGAVRMGDLAQALDIAPWTLSRRVKVLVERGLLECSVGEDNRMRLVRLSPAGDDKRIQATGHWHRAEQGLNGTYGVPRLLRLEALIEDLAQIVRLR